MIDESQKVQHIILKSNGKYFKLVGDVDEVIREMDEVMDFKSLEEEKCKG